VYDRIVSNWTIFRIALEERLVYRADFAMGTLMRFLPIITQIFLWQAIFLSQARDQLAGYRYQDFVAYYLLTMIARAFSSMPGLASGIAEQVRNGEIKKFLIQPVDLLSFLLLGRIAHKCTYYAIAILPFGLVFFLCRDYFMDGFPDGLTFCAFLCSLIMGFMIGFFLEAAIGMIGFWLLEVSSLLFIYMLFNFFLSGHMFPLDMLKEVQLWGDWSCFDLVKLLPLQYLAYFPVAVFLKKVEGLELITGLCIEAGWLVFFIIFARCTFRMGVRRYSGFGG